MLNISKCVIGRRISRDDWWHLPVKIEIHLLFTWNWFYFRSAKLSFILSFHRIVSNRKHSIERMHCVLVAPEYVLFIWFLSLLCCFAKRILLESIMLADSRSNVNTYYLDVISLCFYSVILNNLSFSCSSAWTKTRYLWFSDTENVELLWKKKFSMCHIGLCQKHKLRQFLPHSTHTHTRHTDWQTFTLNTRSNAAI